MNVEPDLQDEASRILVWLPTLDKISKYIGTTCGGYKDSLVDIGGARVNTSGGSGSKFQRVQNFRRD